MAEAVVIARVAALQGEVFARSPEGTVRRLKVGDPVREGDVIVPGAGGRVELALQDGTTRLVGSGEQLTVDAEVAAEVKPGAADAALTAQIRDGQGRIFAEDTQMLEQQQRNLLQWPGRRVLKLNIDAGGVHARRVIERCIAAERPPVEAAA